MEGETAHLVYIGKQASMGTCDFIQWGHLEDCVEHASELSHLRVGKLGHLFTIFHFSLIEALFFITFGLLNIQAEHASLARRSRTL